MVLKVTCQTVTAIAQGIVAVKGLISKQVSFVRGVKSSQGKFCVRGYLVNTFDKEVFKGAFLINLVINRIERDA